jgi:AraC family transcriptional regulator
MQTLKSAEFFYPHRARTPSPAGVAVRTLDLQPGLAVSLERFDVQQDLSPVMEAEGAHVHFSCLLCGAICITYDDQQLELDRDDVLSTFMPGKRFQVRCNAGSCNVELRIAPDLLGQLAGEECRRSCLTHGSESCLLRAPNNLRIRDAADRLGRLLAEENASLLLVHAAALEFLAWNLKSSPPEMTGPGIAPRERQQLLSARERLLSDLSNPPTIEQLAREAGLNQLKIKRGFNILFGISVYALFQRERMEEARRLLQRHSVTETASLLGYSNLSHFSAAFRKQFGMLPREIRRNLIR